jgi:hypothetical protein
MKYDKKMKLVAFYIGEEQNNLLKAVVKKTHIAQAEIIRMALEEFLKDK